MCILAFPAAAGTVQNSATGDTGGISFDLTGSTISLSRVAIDL